MTIATSTPSVAFEEDSITSTVSSIRWLVAPTSRLWVEQAIAKPMQVLIDHAHCERKAAGSAVQLMFRYLCEPGLGEVLSPLAREELEHFEQVLDLLKSRGRYLEPLRSPGYGADLAKHVRRAEPDRMLDSFLVAGLIEASSHERMALLAEHSPDQGHGRLTAACSKGSPPFRGVLGFVSRDIQMIVPRLEQLAEAEVDALRRAGAPG